MMNPPLYIRLEGAAFIARVDSFSVVGKVVGRRRKIQIHLIESKSLLKKL